MKKLLSVFMSFVIISLTVFCVPFTAKAATYTPNVKIYADAYMLISLDDDSHPVVAEKNADKRKYPASLTKIVTTMVTLNKVQNLSQTTTVSKSAIEALYGTGAQVAGLKIGQTITIEELLYLTMVHSACDACQVLAEFVSGSVPAFVEEMNNWVKSLGCKDTNFVNPDGLHDPNHYTTPSDMAKITLAAMKNEIFNKISSTQQYKFGKLNFIHTNYMLDKFHVTYYYPYAQGIKTGSTEQAGYCVITKASKGGYNYLAIVMDSPIEVLDGIKTKCSFIDAKSLFNWAFDSLKYTTVVRKNDIAYELPVNNGKDADTVQLVVKDDVTTLVPSTLDPSNVIIEPVDPPESLDAPVTKDDFVCKANVIFGEKTIVTVDLVAAKTVELSTFLKILNALKKFFTNKIVLTVLGVIVLLAILYIVTFVRRLRRDKERVAKRRREQEELDKQLYGDDDYLPPPRPRR
ncbi:D-alanyl-D-alanine carboxypeptidase family protein [Eubacterium coprostanoligenes]|uniref:D-alanyl-D-alanine carboxypeptidase family protein n=1 Tax=Eubacterium coprostanoligenes TaxID=290054 RepID=UPI002357D277|nr:D-alanyl-D-alanine carboxypeptidase family protein [Eubacterium coprostanoligenes]MCI6254915.1 D-alanyl-D-alanine carboxypeptidase [Eubacterium coprostanoligenes]MCI6355007.1 D-alanyl-D-alanine carboxypeptidase [Eubacterium coprostanoligenes]MDY5400210.1 D-alanyl-D-alanine carboxypeptidase family protein [Eubacterium coprostanoligenes]